MTTRPEQEAAAKQVPVGVATPAHPRLAEAAASGRRRRARPAEVAEQLPEEAAVSADQRPGAAAVQHQEAGAASADQHPGAAAVQHQEAGAASPDQHPGAAAVQHQEAGAASPDQHPGVAAASAVQLPEEAAA